MAATEIDANKAAVAALRLVLIFISLSAPPTFAWRLAARTIAGPSASPSLNPC